MRNEKLLSEALAEPEAACFGTDEVMETTIGIIGFILGFYRDNGKENGSYKNMFQTRGLDIILLVV